ncbi:MAG: DUF2520 domain-containing protein [Candidatus Melainabacteria bacterium]|jgi:predicted short-subunit dehydrogenase-like oxidoreductase (DUF2520 family)|nr:DUF2520 domain-containing protein [Candidatus Melainabacteria bacterium]
MVEIHSLAVIGPGKVGTAVAFAARRAGVREIYLGGRHQDRTEAAAKLVEGAKAWRVAEAANHAELVLICVSDDQIALVAKQLAQEEAFRKGAVVAHLSGALDSEVLQPAVELCGALTASAHPLKTFPSVAAAIAEEPGTHWFLEGDSEAVKTISAFVERLGDFPHAITREGKAIYHAASVVACNYLTTLMDTALEMMEQADIDRDIAWAALKPLVFRTMENIDKMGPEAALTGPIARADEGTVLKHVTALQNSPASQRMLYVALALKTVELARRKGSIDEGAATKISEKLGQMF